MGNACRQRCVNTIWFLQLVCILLARCAAVARRAHRCDGDRPPPGVDGRADSAQCRAGTAAQRRRGRLAHVPAGGHVAARVARHVSAAGYLNTQVLHEADQSSLRLSAPAAAGWGRFIDSCVPPAGNTVVLVPAHRRACARATHSLRVSRQA